jgi:hypothetical protein
VVDGATWRNHRVETVRPAALLHTCTPGWHDSPALHGRAALHTSPLPTGAVQEAEEGSQTRVPLQGCAGLHGSLCHLR